MQLSSQPVSFVVIGGVWDSVHMGRVQSGSSWEWKSATIEATVSHLNEKLVNAKKRPIFSFVS